MNRKCTLLLSGSWKIPENSPNFYFLSVLQSKNEGKIIISQNAHLMGNLS
jgi:hypothetical protein